MDDWASGFRIDEAFHPWGTLFDVAAPGRVDSGYSSVELPCRSAYGFATVYAEPTAPRPDRPVTSVAYELADTGEPSRNLFAQLVIRLGAPDEVDRGEEPEGAGASDSVVLHANWRRDKIAIGLSLYGAPRPSDFGDGLGKLYLSWADADAAAAPFVAEWTAASEALERAAATAKTKVLSVQYPIYEADFAPPQPHELALSMPDLLRTPPAIAELLGPTSFAVWSNHDEARWHLSTRYSTVALEGPESSSVQFIDLAPAKGGGYAALDVGSWSVRDAHGSASIKEAADILEKLAGLKVVRHTGYDA